jgi:hypothetical protein
MLDEARRAFNVSVPPRDYVVFSNFDEPTIPLPVGDGTVGVTAARPAARAR